MHSEDIKALDLKELLNSKEQYSIPIYQRNYAWEAKEIEQLIQDVIDYSIHHQDKNYYIGTLVVSAEDNNFSTIDGQQRLTTLSIICAVIKNLHKEVDMDWFQSLNLRYQSREKSTLSMGAAFNGVFEDLIHYETSIKLAYDICSKEIVKKTKENGISVYDFAEYLLKYVKLLRVPLPDGTDLNHYFEIMNSRGEQLEKHEILKAKLMESFNELEENLRAKYSYCFHLIWEACSNMEKYVQYGFTVEQRHLIFGENNWNTLTVNKFEELVSKIDPTLTDAPEVELSIEDIISGQTMLHKPEESHDSPERFNSVINFQNFLLHVLRVQVAKDEVALDDKRLIDIFEKVMPSEMDGRIEFVKEFIFNLLKSKFLFDKYVIKREFTANTDRWSLKSLKWYTSGKVKNGVKYTNTFGEPENDSFDGDNRKALMLLSMFHVSIPSMSYKYWLNASLNYLFNQFEIDNKDYISYLEHIAKLFVFDKHLSKEPMDYFEMIYKNLMPIQRKIGHLDINKLSYVGIENNLVFNFLDYLLWVQLKDIEKDSRVKAFEYTFRSSVEHYYPQNSINKDLAIIDDNYLHSFGNLCLISHEKNSRLNNNTPLAKKDYYSKNTSIDSLKQFTMMKETSWSVQEIKLHNTAMIHLLSENLNSDFKISGEISLAKKWFSDYKLSNKVLLARTLLCFSDIAKYNGSVLDGSKWNLFDWDEVRNSDGFNLFLEYFENSNPKSCDEIIENKLRDSEAVKPDDYRYLFVKYPLLIEYCKEGNFGWLNDGKRIVLLETSRISDYKAKEVYSYLLENFLLKEYNLKIFSNYTGIYLHLKYENGTFAFTKHREPSNAFLHIWNENGESINHALISDLHGKSNYYKIIMQNKWYKNDNGSYARFGKSELISLGDNYEENFEHLKTEFLKLLKIGLNLLPPKKDN